jgi:LacI family transcriptional regulator
LLTLLRAKETDQKIRDTLKDLAARRVDGIVFAIPEFNDNRAWINEEVLNRLPPIVFLNMESRSGINIVSVDNKAGARLAVTHLLEQGRKRIATICGPQRWWEARQRLAGWKEVLDQAGYFSSADMIAEGDWSAESGERAMRQLLESAPNIDAVFVANDQMALGALGVLHQRGISVPDDIAVVGFDNVPDSAYFYPPLSTIDQPLLELGRVGVQKLNQMIATARRDDDGMEKSTTLLMPKMIVRQSSVEQENKSI